MSTISERMEILKMIAEGIITPDEGTQLLQALAIPRNINVPSQSEQIKGTEFNSDTSPAGQIPLQQAEHPDSSQTAQADEVQKRRSRWQSWLSTFLYSAVAVTILSGLLLFWVWQSTGLSFWFGCAWLPLLISLGAIVLFANLRSATWVHVRIHQKPGVRPRKIAISLPIPLRLAGWFIRKFGQRIPGLKNTGLDQLLLALEDSSTSQTPFYIEVDEGEDGERIQVYIG